MIGFILGFLVGFPVEAWAFRQQYSNTKIRTYQDWVKLRNYLLHLHDGEPIEGGEE